MRNYWKIFILSAALAVAACGGKESPDVKPSAPSAPTSLVVFQSGDNSLTFQWDKMENATSYEWVLTQGGAEVQKGTVTARNVTVSGLDKGTAY
ncbi:MAG: fibronectin type III domain-containing protein, partial [Bacteroidales bacterium]|nr:fibronectin type III domain-containing protein [Bacteroidales bacterium]